MNTETDIVEELNNEAVSVYRHPDIDGLCARAAAEITKLRAERDAWKRAAEEGMESSARAARDTREER